MNELISIIVPVYGVEKYLRQCVDSVLAQTYSNWELILVDDGSPDSCPSICDEYAAADSRIRVIHQTNGGLSVARNSGLRIAKGKYVSFVDADDRVHPEYLRSLTNIIADAQADVSCVDFTEKDFKSIKCKKADIRTYTGIEFSRKLLYQDHNLCTHSACGKLYRRDVLSCDPFLAGIGYEDLEAFYRIFPRLNLISYAAQKLYYYRPNPQSYLHRFTHRRADVLDVTDNMVEYFNESGKFPNKELFRAARDRHMSAHFNIFGLMAANGYKDKDLEARCWGVIKSERFSSLTNPNVRLKNKLGALLSYFGKPVLRLFSKIIYR